MRLLKILRAAFTACAFVMFGMGDIGPGADGKGDGGKTAEGNADDKAQEKDKEVADSAKLRENMKAPPDGEKPPPYPNAAHHIVAGNDHEAQDARKVLDDFGIGINDKENGAFLRYTEKGTGTLHSGQHHDAYYRTVNKMLKEANSKEEAIGILGDIKKLLQSGALPL
ncbi:MAG: AHH domain-containing protein [Clostridiales bacterium]|nr:AHH domain-containing protein [Clostridiales bacterium]